MGVFDFVKNAGARIGIGEGAESSPEPAAASADEAASASGRMQGGSAQAAEKTVTLEESKKAAGLAKYIADLDIEIENLDVRYDDGVATISGVAKDQETREKAILAIGNVAEVGQVQDDIQVKEDSPESKMHVVVQGDTLSAIAKEHYGDANKYNAIFAANRPMLSDPDKIYVGQVLRVPALEA